MSDSGKSSSRSTEIRKEGNALFLQNKSHNDRLVLSLYTKSIAYAPMESEELALAYGNRSALWLHLQKYELCIIDIHRALDITKSKDLVQKLLLRQKQCLKHIPRSSKHGKKEPKVPKITPSKSVPCGSNCIEPGWNKKYGRHYVASRDIKAGTVLMCEKTSYAFVDVEHMYLVCSHCLSLAGAGIPCDYCIFTVYCSDTCKKEAWTEYHDVICALFSIDSFSLNFHRYLFQRQMQDDDNNNISFGPFMASIRMVIIILRKEGSKTILETAQNLNKRNDEGSAELPCGQTPHCSSFEFLYRLSACRENMHECTTGIMSKLKKAFTKTSDSFSQILPSESISSMQNVFEKLYRIYESNSFLFSSSDCKCEDPVGGFCDRVKGCILGPCSSLFNHSCDQNVDRLFLKGPRIMFFANQPIKKGEQLFISYGPILTMDRLSRQTMLKDHYSFTCECGPCTENWPVVASKEVIIRAPNDIDLELTRRLGGDEQRYKFLATQIVFNDKYFNTAVEMLNFIYKKIDRKEAALEAQIYKLYIRRFFIHLYRENLQLHHLYDIHVMLDSRNE
ncbi:hypothetical protein QAD02_015599 [Eretmocerus hayati]|uniref:Uncharacterized protein n=1 Tax=Eretmocerus hayati TaxID=131215 RepID=A0ACC2PBH3_9HYME|nr:hypothetical protein QAD02_015599 [Eretmocerus hayati]